MISFPILFLAIALLLGVSACSPSSGSRPQTADPVASNSVPSDPTDDFIRAEMRRQTVPGLSLAVLRHGKVIKAAGYGFSSIRNQTPATPETIFKIASVSKQFIAAGILTLVQAGQLRLDDSISRYLKDAPSAWSGITIRHLLTHTSGLVRESPGFGPFKVQSDSAVIRAAYAVPLRFSPGDRWEYSNLGYFVLADVIRLVSGRPWPDYLAERIFRPLGMTSTYPTNTEIVLPNRAQGMSIAMPIERPPSGPRCVQAAPSFRRCWTSQSGMRRSPAVVFSPTAVAGRCGPPSP